MTAWASDLEGILNGEAKQKQTVHNKLSVILAGIKVSRSAEHVLVQNITNSHQCYWHRRKLQQGDTLFTINVDKWFSIEIPESGTVCLLFRNAEVWCTNFLCFYDILSFKDQKPETNKNPLKTDQ